MSPGRDVYYPHPGPFFSLSVQISKQFQCVVELIEPLDK